MSYPLTGSDIGTVRRDLIRYSLVSDSITSREIHIGINIQLSKQNFTIGENDYQIPIEKKMLWLLDQDVYIPPIGAPLRRRQLTNIRRQVDVIGGVPRRLGLTSGSGFFSKSWVNRRVYVFDDTDKRLHRLWVHGYDAAANELTFFPDELDETHTHYILMPYEIDPSCFILTHRTAVPSGKNVDVNLVYTNYSSADHTVHQLRETVVDRHIDLGGGALPGDGRVPIMVRWNPPDAGTTVWGTPQTVVRNATVTVPRALTTEELVLYAPRRDVVNSAAETLAGALNNGILFGHAPGKLMVLAPEIAPIAGTRRSFATFRLQLAPDRESHVPSASITLEDGRTPPSIAPLPQWTGADLMYDRTANSGASSQWEVNGQLRPNVMRFEEISQRLWNMTTIEDGEHDGPFIWDNVAYLNPSDTV